MKFTRLVKCGKEIFEYVLEHFSKYIRVVSDDEMDKKLNKKLPFKKIYYNNTDRLVLRSYLIYSYDKNVSTYEQIELHLEAALKPVELQQSLRGFQAYQQMRKFILKYYDKDEYEHCLTLHSAPYNPKLKQINFSGEGIEQDKIFIFRNCYKYDINSAYAKCLMLIFPKAAKAIEKLYNRRYESSELKLKIKQMFNYYVGDLCNHKHRETFNWIVQYTRRQMNNAIREVGGTILYARTDSLIVCKPTKLITPSKEIGEFKLEYQGDVYLYKDKNYFVFYTDEYKGNILNKMRKYLDLPNGKVVHYDTYLHDYIRDGQNIVLEEKQIEEEYYTSIY